MANPVWAEARRRARAETLDLIRLNDPYRALLTIGVPAVALTVCWEAIGQFAIATVAALGASLLFGLVIYSAKLVLAPAQIAAENAEQAEIFADQIASIRSNARRDYMVDLVRRIIEIYMSGDGISAEMMAGLELPPAAWINEQLAKRGEAFTVTTQGHQFFVHEAAARQA